MFEGEIPPGGLAQPECREEPPYSIPWQVRGRYPSMLTAVLETIKLVLLQPSQAFSNMRVENSLGESLIYVLVLGSIGGIIGQVFQAALQATLTAVGAGERAAMFGGITFTVRVVMALVIVPVGVLIGMFIGAGILHLCLMIVGGANKSFEATFGVAAYCVGSTALFQVVPVCGALVAAIWNIVIEIIGLARAHNTTTGRAAFAVLAPFALVVCCCAMVFVMVMALGALAVVLGMR